MWSGTGLQYNEGFASIWKQSGQSNSSLSFAKFQNIGNGKRTSSLLWDSKIVENTMKNRISMTMKNLLSEMDNYEEANPSLYHEKYVDMAYYLLIKTDNFHIINIYQLRINS